MNARTFETSKPPRRRPTAPGARAPNRSCDGATPPAGAGECERLNVAICWRRRGDGVARGDRKALTGKRGAQNLENVKLDIDQNVVYLVTDPISAWGRAVGLQSSLARAGAVAKVAEMTELPFFELARAFGGGKAILGVANRRAGDRGPTTVAGRLDYLACEASVARWREGWKAPVNLHQCGVLRTYADQVEPARLGAVSHAGGRTNVGCDAEI